jgi:Tol biopolymer transport system component
MWSTDGNRVAFSSIRGVETGLYIQDVGNGGTEKQVLRSSSMKYLSDWSRDGRFLLYRQISEELGMDVWALPVASGNSENKPMPFAATKFNETQGRFSPDAHWVAYASDDSGRSEIYVRPFPPDVSRGGRWQVSSAGGSQPRWRGDGKELFYLAPDRKLMAVEIRTEPAFQRGTPHP